MFGLTKDEKRGIVGASGGSAGSAASRTRKRAKVRRHRRENSRILLLLSQENPAGSKRLRKYRKALTGEPSRLTGLAEARAGYAQLAEARYRRGESRARIAAGTAW